MSWLKLPSKPFQLWFIFNLQCMFLIKAVQHSLSKMVCYSHRSRSPSFSPDTTTLSDCMKSQGVDIIFKYGWLTFAVSKQDWRVNWGLCPLMMSRLTNAKAITRLWFKCANISVAWGICCRGTKPGKPPGNPDCLQKEREKILALEKGKQSVKFMLGHFQVILGALLHSCE